VNALGDPRRPHPRAALGLYENKGFVSLMRTATSIHPCGRVNRDQRERDFGRTGPLLCSGRRASSRALKGCLVGEFFLDSATVALFVLFGNLCPIMD
jgi:hypothetical protein